MRVLIEGAGEIAARIASALARDGFVIAEPAAPFDVLLTLGDRPGRLQAGDIMLDLATRRAARGGRPLRLTGIEFAILAHLVRERRPVGRAALLEAVWGYRFDPGTNLVAVHVARLRTKIGRDAVMTVEGGYALAGSGPMKLVGATGFEPATPRPPV